MPADNQIPYSPQPLTECGIRNLEQALTNLKLLSSRFGEQAFSDLLPVLFPLLSVAADPDMALNNFERFAGALTDVPSFFKRSRAKPNLLVSLIAIFGASRFLSSFLISRADESLLLLTAPGFLTDRTGKERLNVRLAGLIADHPDDKNFFRLLRLFRKQEMLRIGVRDLLGKADLQETVADLSDLAEVCLQKAYEWADAGLRSWYGRPMTARPDGTAATAGFAVIAMGKLGGYELNFSSDVDLMYAYEGEGETEGVSQSDGSANRITNHQYFIKLSEKLSAAIGEKTEDGFVFRVDLRLRPEGQRGPIAQSLGGYEIYYESWGQTWERSALIKARPVAGDEAVGREFMERITPFVYRKYLDYGAIAEIRDMKQRINKEVEQKGRTHRDVKLGYGGIREIEFVIQALQLIYAGRDRSLRERNALKALHMLSQKGLISYQEHADLARAYIFLRTVEHRIQILNDLQTQTLPAEEEEMRSLARRTGYLDHEKEAELLLRDYTECTRQVRSIYDDLFAFRGEEKRPETAGHEYDILLNPDTGETESVALFRSFGFRDPEKAYRNLLLLREGPAFVHQTPRSRKLFTDIFPSLFREIVNSPDPDAALNHLESFLASQGSWETFQSLMKLDASAVNVLITIFANSDYFSRMLVSRPVLLENLLEPRKAYGPGTAARFSKQLADALERATGLSEKIDALRRIKHQEEIRIGMADLRSNLPLASVSRDLSKLAETCLQTVFNLAVSEVSRRSGSSGAGLAIIGVGKLGGRELGYGSDLDILFVFSETRAELPPPDLSVFEYFSRVAEKIISYLSSLTREGFVFRVDTRLRPTGSKGPLVQSVDAFRSYYAAHAETWERQALLRARFVAGDRAVGAEFCETIQELIFQEGEARSLAEDIRTMRKRMEEEVAKESSASYNIKQGAGGIVDIEFLIQYLQLLHGKKHPHVRVPGTLNALRALKKLKLLPPEDSVLLLNAYRFMRKLESRMRIISNQAADDLSRDPGRLQILAKGMGYRDEQITAGEKLLHEYESLSRQVREIFIKILS